MKRFLFKFSCVLVVLGGLISWTRGQIKYEQLPTWDNGISHSTWEFGLSGEHRKKILELWDSIGEDLKTDTNELAGTYVKGGYSSGYLLRWSLNKGFVVIPYFDQNLITDYGYGKVKFVDTSEVIFITEKELNGGRGLAKMPRTWTAIWGYFSPVDTLSEFAEYRAGLGDYNNFNGDCCDFTPDFLCSRIDRPEKPLPQLVPDKYKHLVRNPIQGEITVVGKKRIVRNWGYDGTLYQKLIEKAVLIPVVINIGKLNGVKRNMLFRIPGEPAYTHRYVQVMNAGQQTSRALVVHQFLEDGKEDMYKDYDIDQYKPLPSIRSGTGITTSPVID